MSRETKFRTWSKLYKQWCGGTSYIDGVWLGWICRYGKDIMTQDIILEQYTGLKDKNDKEIYEGDILDTPGGRCLCVWNGDGWAYQFKVHKTDWFDIVKDFHKNSEVIGNIHENKEWLGGEE